MSSSSAVMVAGVRGLLGMSRRGSADYTSEMPGMERTGAPPPTRPVAMNRRPSFVMNLRGMVEGIGKKSRRPSTDLGAVSAS